MTETSTDVLTALESLVAGLEAEMPAERIMNPLFDGAAYFFALMLLARL